MGRTAGMNLVEWSALKDTNPHPPATLFEGLCLHICT